MFDRIAYALTDAIRKNDLRTFIATSKSDVKWQQRLIGTDFSLPVFHSFFANPQ
jgi:hypothetical protein